MLTTIVGYAQPTVDSIWTDVLSVRFKNPDSAIVLLENQYTTSMAKKDTINAIRSLTSLATVYGTQAQYKGAYDQLWKALFLADEANLEERKAYINRRIGRYYAFYKRHEKALYFLNESLQLKKSLVERGEVDTASLTHTYSSISLTYQEIGELEMAQLYLDSCFLYLNKGKGSKKEPFLEIEQGFILCKNGDYEEAIQLLEKNVDWIEKRLPSYLVLVYSYLGDAYKGKNRQLDSEKYYQKALSVSEEYNSHLDFSILVHQKLSDLYAEQGRHLAAYEKLKTVQQLDKLYFDSRSSNNRPLLEIQDEFRKELENNKQLLKEQRIAQLEHESEINFLQKVIIFILLIFSIISGLVYFYHLRKRHQAEKKLAQKERALELQKNKELLELKNKELTTFALKLIEKDKFLYELKEKVTNKQNDVSLQEIKRAIKKTTINSAENWEEFEARFIDVNKSFYENLRTQFPNLTRGDHKLCALLKLNLSSKEMARLMGISIESVHTTRYRLRKKLGLSKGMDLNEFIARF